MGWFILDKCIQAVADTPIAHGSISFPFQGHQVVNHEQRSCCLLIQGWCGDRIGGGLVLDSFSFFFFFKPARTTGSVGERAGPHLDCLSF